MLSWPTHSSTSSTWNWCDMLLISSNANDIQKYYEGSYVKLSGFGDKLFFIQKVTQEGIYCVDGDTDEYLIHLHDSVPYELTMTLPNKAFYQMGHHCYSLARIPARQYHRGITSANCAIQRLDVDGWKKQSCSFSTLQGYVQKALYRPLSEVVETCKGSEAISERFAYQYAGNRIWCDHRIVGTVNTVQRTVQCNILLERAIQRILDRNDMDRVFKVVAV